MRRNVVTKFSSAKIDVAASGRSSGEAIFEDHPGDEFDEIEYEQESPPHARHL
jgi:hypothetical protein